VTSPECYDISLVLHLLRRTKGEICDITKDHQNAKNGIKAASTPTSVWAAAKSTTRDVTTRTGVSTWDTKDTNNTITSTSHSGALAVHAARAACVAPPSTSTSTATVTTTGVTGAEGDAGAASVAVGVAVGACAAATSDAPSCPS